MSGRFTARCWSLADATQTRAAGAALGHELLTLDTAQPLLVTLQGELGAGKTTLVGGLFNALGYVGPVRSPTYTLIEPYELAGRQFYHLDLYRLTDPLQLEDLGVRDLLQPKAVLLVEWPERAGQYLPLADLAIKLEYAPQGALGRELCLLPRTESVQKLADRLVF